ncbi:Rrf2 family protein [Acetitomaculum ruminis DSM 5522]|uniref:Rrf2 family protein n=1 Tax=Acetitomaculum ruminis DSM 5522 TaxID=1120918 RepID=A0A1I1ABQ6_9FIRM|nr:Rrf2 family transcriptional regulator [Acetitomaculum ruminis]SFB35421.1 Rrf2 family protein [Acetitomaculum ruminis DSM 5522]
MFGTKGRYALRVMIDLSQQDPDTYIPLKDIANRQDISKKYLEIIVKELVHGGLVVGVSGKGGGYKLTRKPEEYSVGEIIELLEGSLAPVSCLADGATDCPREEVCKTLFMWTEFYTLEKDFFYGKKLSDLVNS